MFLPRQFAVNAVAALLFAWVTGIRANDAISDGNPDASSSPPRAVGGLILGDPYDKWRQSGDVFSLYSALSRPENASNPRALYELGLIHAAGSAPFLKGAISAESIAVDKQRALETFLRAAELGHREATYELAEMYYLGNGVAKDYKRAMQYYERAAALGEVRAQGMLGALLMGSDAVDADIPSGVNWIRKSAERGYPVAELNLALMYERGFGVQSDKGMALKWAGVAERWFPGADETVRAEATKVSARLRAALSASEIDKAKHEADTIIAAIYSQRGDE